ncbi:MAG TPA: GIY-YIG nuclease family protein [Flavisolibacter sp.]|jgi:putative endonuclease|nr:GIY-YIG nuclease family protein [Flavisolibacter sp.]
MERGGCVYILTNKHHTVLYTGVTGDLISRVQQHICKHHVSAFTAKYNVEKLVYYRFFPTIEEAIAEEKRIKAGSRQKKIYLIESLNPAWADLWTREVSKW